MVAREVWGFAAWTFLHTVAEKIKPSEFARLRDDLIGIFRKTTHILPCPICLEHAQAYLKRIDWRAVRTKEDYISLIHTFHNVVNRRLGTPQMPLEDCRARYKKALTGKTFQHFFAVLSMEPVGTPRPIVPRITRQRCLNEMSTFLRANYGSFDP